MEGPRRSYWHTRCGKITTIEDPVFAGLVDTPPPLPFPTLFCAHCNEAGPVGPAGEFHWCDRGNIATMAPLRQQKVGT